MIFVFAYVLHLGTAQAQIVRYPQLDKMIPVDYVDLTYTPDRESRLRAFMQKRYGQSSPSDQSEWSMVHPDFREQVVREQAFDAGVRQRLNDDEVEVTPIPHGVSWSTLALIKSLAKDLHLDADLKRTFIHQTYGWAQFRSPVDHVRLTKQLTIDAEILAYLIKRFRESPADSAADQKMLALDLLRRTYVTMGQGPTARWARLTSGVMMGRAEGLSYYKMFWLHVRGVLLQSSEGRRIMLFDRVVADDLAPTRSENNPVVIASRVIDAFGGWSKELLCASNLGVAEDRSP